MSNVPTVLSALEEFVTNSSELLARSVQSFAGNWHVFSCAAQGRAARSPFTACWRLPVSACRP